MTDDDRDLHQRFAELRSEEARSIPRFQVRARRPSRRWQLALAASVLLAIVVLIRISDRPSRTALAFSEADRAAVESMAGWHPPTEFLLHTPGGEMLTTTPLIPEPLKGVSP